MDGENEKRTIMQPDTLTISTLELRKIYPDKWDRVWQAIQEGHLPFIGPSMVNRAMALHIVGESKECEAAKEVVIDTSAATKISTKPQNENYDHRWGREFRRFECSDARCRQNIDPLITVADMFAHTIGSSLGCTKCTGNQKTAIACEEDGRPVGAKYYRSSSYCFIFRIVGDQIDFLNRMKNVWQPTIGWTKERATGYGELTYAEVIKFLKTPE